MIKRIQAILNMLSMEPIKENFDLIHEVLTGVQPIENALKNQSS